MMKPLIIGNPTNNTAPDYRHSFNTADGSFRINLAAITNLAITVPTDARVVLFSYEFTGSVWVSPQVIVGIPAPGFSDSGVFKYNPAVHLIGLNEPTLNFFSEVTITLLANFYTG